MIKKLLIMLMSISFLFQHGLTDVFAENEEVIESPHAILMEASTGTIIYEKEKDTQVSPASITKIMTLILIFDEIENGNLSMDELVTTSAYAKSMGGSQVFLEEGEQQTVETMIKCIVIASGNDASVAMAEHIAGSENDFVKKMNERAQGLGMKHTHFEDCCGLTESTNHYTCAYDVALMSRELITKYPDILKYSSVWMEDITHKTSQGSSPFTLTNTNKLIRGYEGCMGLKTGSTSLAKYCVSAVAKRNDITLISVVMTAPDYKARFRDAAAMLNWGFSKCQLYKEDEAIELLSVKVQDSMKKSVSCSYESPFLYLDTQGNDLNEIKKKVLLKESIKAPVNKGDITGYVKYYLNGEEIGTVRIVADENVEKAEFRDYFKMILRYWIL